MGLSLALCEETSEIQKYSGTPSNEETNLFVYTNTHRSRKAYCAILVRRSNSCYHARAPSGGRWNYGRETSGNFAEMMTFTLHLGIFYVP